VTSTTVNDRSYLGLFGRILRASYGLICTMCQWDELRRHFGCGHPVFVGNHIELAVFQKWAGEWLESGIPAVRTPQLSNGPTDMKKCGSKELRRNSRVVASSLQNVSGHGAKRRNAAPRQLMIALGWLELFRAITSPAVTRRGWTVSESHPQSRQ
jgi:hypothetical protein